MKIEKRITQLLRSLTVPISEQGVKNSLNSQGKYVGISLRVLESEKTIKSTTVNGVKKYELNRNSSSI